jgi:putative glutamine amidotransferase
VKKPIIAITTNFTSSELLNKPVSAYADAVTGAGGTPHLLPRDIPLSQIGSQRNGFAGLILSGGGDIDIRYFNGEPNPAIGEPSPQRDALELALVKLALETDCPVFGICRGIQVLNVALGGTLYTDIPSQYKTSIVHSTPANLGRQFLAHEVEIDEDSQLAHILGSNRIEVNSFHHQAIKELAKGLKVTARAIDGLIEAVELTGARKPVFGVQWHPENLQAMPVHKALFLEFIRSCK